MMPTFCGNAKASNGIGVYEAVRLWLHAVVVLPFTFPMACLYTWWEFKARWGAASREADASIRLREEMLRTKGGTAE